MSEQLEERFSDVVDIVRSGLASGREKSYFPTVFAFFPDSVELHSMFTGLPPTGVLDAVERFGFSTGKRKRVPDFLFFAAESMDDSLMISGCAPSETLVGYIGITRDEAQSIILGSVKNVGYASAEDLNRVPAWRAMQGAIAKSKTPWWKL